MLWATNVRPDGRSFYARRWLTDIGAANRMARGVVRHRDRAPVAQLA